MKAYRCRLSALLLLAFGLAGPLGAWQGLAPALLLPCLLWLPGAVALDLLRPKARGREGGLSPGGLPSVEADGYAVPDPLEFTPAYLGPGRIALEAALSLALFLPGVLPLFLLHLDISAARFTLGTAYALLGALAVMRPRPRETTGREGLWLAGQWGASLFALALLLPAVVAYAGGTVDDWWDLAFVGAYAGEGVLGFAEPMLDSGRVHPRFLWNVWLVLQALVVHFSGVEGWSVQSVLLAPATCILSVSALAFFAASLFPERRPELIATIAVMPFWLYGTEAFPYFTRLHQDKFVAACVFLPLLLGCGVRYLRRAPELGPAILASVATTAACVHGLIYCIDVLGLALCALAMWKCADGRNTEADTRRVAIALAAVGLPLLYPLAQGLLLRPMLAAQGIALAAADNPVVRAHLALDRLLWPESWAYVVSPDAVFGSIALLAALGVPLAVVRRREQAAAVVLALTVVPCALVFVPGVTAIVGALWVPWMLYRIAWLVPVPALLALVLGRLLAIERSRLRNLALAVAGVVMLASSVPQARDRVRRHMMPRPFPRETAPRGHTLEAYRFLATTEDRGPVLAPPVFAGLVPALSGRPVVAFSERGTLVFAGEEREAYRRLRDSATFFAALSENETRLRIARDYRVAHAVFRKRYMPAGSEPTWLARFSAEGLLQVVADSDHGAAGASSLARALPVEWKTVFENDAFLVVEVAGADLDVGAAHSRPLTARATAGGPTGSEPTGVQWLASFDIADAGRRVGRSGAGNVLGAVVGYPGMRVTLDPVPLILGMSDKPVWSRGPNLWDDGPSEARVSLDLGVRCRPSHIRLTPFLPNDRREVIDLSLDGLSSRRRASDGIPIVVDLDGGERSVVTFSVRSMLGAPIALSNIEILGESASCGPEWPVYAETLQAGAEPQLVTLLDLQRAYPRSARPAISLARRRVEAGASADGEALLHAAWLRDPDLANAWIELGLLRDEAGRFEQALQSYRNAVAADSNNAWAQGTLAWAHYRRGASLLALVHARKAAVLDESYGDAHTVMAYVWRSLGLESWAERSLAEAESLDPLRNWPYIARAEFAVADGRPAQAKRILAGYLQRMPSDELVENKLKRLLVARPSGESAPWECFCSVRRRRYGAV